MKKKFFIFLAGGIQVIETPIWPFAIKEKPEEGFDSLKKAEAHLSQYNKKKIKNKKNYYMIIPIYYENIKKIEK